MTLFASVFPILCWLAYNFGVPFVEARRPSLSVIMSMQRRRWVANVTRRETPLDAILSGNLMQSVSFLASTSVLLVLAVFAAFGQLPALMRTLETLGMSAGYSVAEMQIHLLVLLAIFVSSFFSFTLSLRQFNHFCIMLGAISHEVPASAAEIDAIAMLNSLAAKNFNNGIRAYYFAVPAMAWFANPWFAVVITVITVGFIVHREFFSTAHRLAASVAVIASRRERGPEQP
ncbi:MAG: hypothetical protein BGO82_02150 [Devosia sp. 67-54]|uniref:DUF599 domain-containing protein n=1 Tax=unclassified Devosia TaxID=196773 RepID=UPI00095DAFFF|nr:MULTISPECIES: DUF599 domain-containing protein [unclassified Devosia]MBN9305729.1 DUF599 domain-containing protein [Devosia sp.]OJX16555.1 MAG: hypothetical protein BGO82_02150 [Devosia sp. 67-54]